MYRERKEMTRPESTTGTAVLTEEDSRLMQEIAQWAEPAEDLAGIVSVRVVAKRYYPEYNPQAAARALRGAISTYPDLRHALDLVGWSSRKRTFTPLQTKILVHYLGQP